MARLYVLVNHRANKAFKSDSQRLALSLRSSIAKRRSHLNAALVANEKLAAKTECLGLIVRVLYSILHFELRDLGSWELSFDLFLVWFAISEADLLVESQLCSIVSPKGLFGDPGPARVDPIQDPGTAKTGKKCKKCISYSLHL